MVSRNQLWLERGRKSQPLVSKSRTHSHWDMLLREMALYWSNSDFSSVEQPWLPFSPFLFCTKSSRWEVLCLSLSFLIISIIKHSSSKKRNHTLVIKNNFSKWLNMSASKNFGKCRISYAGENNKIIFMNQSHLWGQRIAWMHWPIYCSGDRCGWGGWSERSKLL